MSRSEVQIAGVKRGGVAVFLMVVVAALATLAAASGSADDVRRDLSPGEYFHATGPTEYRTVYENNARWARMTTNSPELDRDLLLRLDDVLYHISTEAKHVLVIRDAPGDLVPEGFVLDPVFLDMLERGDRTYPSATTVGMASGGPGHVTVPHRLEAADTTYVVHRYDSDPEATVERILRDFLSDPETEVLDLADAPQVPLEAGPHGHEEDDS